MGKTELVFVPTPGMGHLLSTVELAKLILRRDHRLSAVILIINSHIIDNAVVNAYIDSQSREADPTRLTFVALPPLPDPIDPSSRGFFANFIEHHKPLVKQAVLDRIESGSPKPAGFILDMFCITMVDVAKELHVDSYIFFTSGASMLNLMYRVQSLADEEGDINVVVDRLSDPDTEMDVPGFRNRVPGKFIPAVYLDKEGGCEMFVNLARKSRESKGILVNTYEELESCATRALLDQAKDNKIPTVYPVGPVLELDSRSRGGSQKDEHDSIMEWLDQQPPSSVVFLCFGSMGSFDEVQVKEIATGLDRAGHRFLWSLRRPHPQGKFGMPSPHETFADALPEGFLERTAAARRGKIIGWAPQVAVLTHRAVGGFVSHCGWNSTLESLWFGVPMATWPLYAEQQLNAFTLVEELGLAVDVRMDYRRDWRTKQANFVVTAEEIEDGVKKLMSMDEERREKVREMSDKGRQALQDGGSSRHWLGRFVTSVLDNVV